ncbi:NDP-sugar dehydratase or epimerase [Amycolatopsis bullii]|uniref:NDP-sugar dehydratase or epimerase n=2 Tax=Pseudonocardiaceae TaxID=2070 RepID=A0ABQ3KJH9_9PSEU|nr:NDP-sugar dehydratase or epimerase [Amycolatopsis bullii]
MPTRISELSSYQHIAVTGGLGFVGRHLVRTLAALGNRVSIVDAAAPDDTTLPCPIRTVDLRDARQTLRALSDVDLVFHLAGNASGTTSVDRPRFDFESNAVTTFNVAEALLNTKARLVYLSTAMVYGEPQTVPVREDHQLSPFLPYGASKLAGEAAVRAFVRTHGLSAVIARAFTIYGPGENPHRAGGEVSQYLRWHLNALPIRVVGDLDHKTRDFVHVADLVRGLIVAADRSEAGRVVNIGSGREFSLRRLIDAIGEATGRRPEIEVVASISDDSYRMVADTAELRALGYQPQVELVDGIRALAAELGPDPVLPTVDTIFRPEQRSRQEEEVAC